MNVVRNLIIGIVATVLVTALLVVIFLGESARLRAETSAQQGASISRGARSYDAYCAGCNAVATTETELVHCDECDKDFKPGTYCAQCNRFMLNAKVHCGNCQAQVVKGHYCTTEKLFKGLPDVAYCPEHDKPYAKIQTCPDCQNQTVETNM